MHLPSIFSIHIYGLIIGLGVLLSYRIAAWFSRIFRSNYSSFRIKERDVWDSLWWVVIPALVGARLFHVISLWDYYKINTEKIFNVWEGGLGVFGAILGGIFGLWLYAKRNNLAFFQLADLAAFGLPVGQAMGRWGNYFNHEIFGKPTSLPWGIYIPFEHRPSQYQPFTSFHPLFFYESLYSLIIFLLLVIICKYNISEKKDGLFFFIYILMYVSGRFFLEYFRTENSYYMGLSFVQVFCCVLAIVSLVGIYKKMKESK